MGFLYVLEVYAEGCSDLLSFCLGSASRACFEHLKSSKLNMLIVLFSLIGLCCNCCKHVKLDECLDIVSCFFGNVLLYILKSNSVLIEK